MVPYQVFLWITQLVFPTRYPPLRFITCAAIGHWSSGCHNIADIETTLLQASEDYKIQISRDIYSISEELWNIIHGDMEWQAHHIQVLLVNESDWCKNK